MKKEGKKILQSKRRREEEDRKKPGPLPLACSATSAALGTY